MNAFITGTDTGVGKTFVTAALLRGLRARGIAAVGFKPICCGGREDAEILSAAADGALTLNEVNPVWLRTPSAPAVAAMIENRPVDLALIREVYAGLRAAHPSVLVEGVGGWLVPIAPGFTVADLAAECGLPVIVVVANRLGALNHAALTVRDIAARGLACAGLMLNDPFPPDRIGPEEEIARTTNGPFLEDWLGVPILHNVPFGQAGLAF